MTGNIPSPDENWDDISIDETVAKLSTNSTRGLVEGDARNRLSLAGPNMLTAEKKISFWEEFFEELREPMILMLLVTGVLYSIWGQLSDAITIFVIIFTLNTVEVLNEVRAKRAISGLRKLAEPTTLVRRTGRSIDLPVEEIVPGDLVLLQAGHRVPADARLVEAFGLATDESALTGESAPVDKSANLILSAATPLAERRNCVYSSTLVTRGKGSAIVFATGMNTQIGKIAGMAHQVREPRTPLQKLMSELSGFLVWFALGFSALVPLIGIFLVHQDPKTMLLTGLSLAFATIPEELPIIITMVLALGAFRLSRKHAIAKRLSAVEVLGAATVIATDKTGTLTENRMTAHDFEPVELKTHLLELGSLANDAMIDGNRYTGDPVDVAILEEAERSGIDAKSIRSTNKLLTEFTFDNERKRMSTVYQKDGQYLVVVKGAPESLLAQSNTILVNGSPAPLTEPAKQGVLDKVAGLAEDGMRVIALAEKSIDRAQNSMQEAESNLTFTGLIGLLDPPRPGVRDSIALCRRAGIRIMMITGDHPLTAQAIARQVGLDGSHALITGPELDLLSEEQFKQVVRSTDIYARTTPEHKLRIVQALQAGGERVAVTGDGINDAPALSAADIGVAMGENGTDVAREASGIVLTNDNFTTIVSAVQEGRLIFENLKKGVRYYLTCKLALVLINLLPTLLLVPVPFAPVQIILMELFMDLMAAAAFSTEAQESDLLDHKPRDPKAKFMDAAMLRSIGISSLGLFAAVTALYLYTWYTSHDLVAAQTVAFTAWLIGHLLLALNMRSEHQPILQIGLFTNRLMLIWGGVILTFLILTSVVPGAHELLKITSLTLTQWIMIIVAVAIGTFWMEVGKLLTYRRKTSA